jgi:tetratricopeptide (TPR) repeat protein
VTSWPRTACRLLQRSSFSREPVHAEPAVGRECAIEKLGDPPAISLMSAVEQHLSVIVLRMCEPWSSTDPLAELEGAREVLLGLVPAPCCGGQDPEVVGDWAEADFGVADRHPVGVGQKTLVEHRGTRRVAQSCCRFGQEAHADRPLLVERDAAEAVGGEGGELASCLVGRAEFEQQVDERAVNDRIGRILRSCMPHQRLDLVCAALFAAQEVELQDVGGRSRPRLRPLAERAGLRDQLVCLVEHPFEQGEEAAVEGDDPAAVALLAEPYDVDVPGLYRATAGNPFYVTEVHASGNDSIPSTVRDAVLARAARLNDEARAVLDAVAIAPPHVDLWLLEALAGEHIGGLVECLSSGMLVEQGAGAISFRHELARLAIGESLEPERRLSLHRAALAALSLPRAGMPDVARLAHHAEASGDPEAVLRYAPAAAERAAAVGAYREAAAQYARVLRLDGRLSAAERAGFLEKRSRACYVTDNIDEAIEAAEEALELRRALAQGLEEGESLVWLSKILWCPGRTADSARAARKAVELLETLPPSRQLAVAYVQKDWALAERALGLAEALGDAELILRIRTILATRDFAKGGRPALEECFELARAAGMAELAGQASQFLVTRALAVRRYDLAARYVDSGLAYCSDLGLELYRFYHLGWLARIELDQGRWDEAADAAAAVLRIRRASIMPRILGLVVLGLVRARRGDPGHRDLLDEAWALAEPTDELFRMGQVVAARAEVAWLAGDPEAVAAITDYPIRLALERQDLNAIGEIGVWRRRAGIDDELSGVPEPYAAELTGDWAQAAAFWRDAGCAYDAALALAGADEEEPLRQALEELQRLEARPAASIVARRLRELGARDIRTGPGHRRARTPPG